MTCYDVFNGDADGLCALQQLRLEYPREAVRITGMKRDIDLLQRVPAAEGDEITVLDISLDKNRDALRRVLDAGSRVFYADHHFPGEIPQHDALECHIDVAADTCTSLIVNDLLEGAQARWAVVGAFGDNFDAPARTLGLRIGLDENALNQLQLLGICLNYNGYGFELEDLLYHPADLYVLYFRLFHRAFPGLFCGVSDLIYQIIRSGDCFRDGERRRVSRLSVAACKMPCRAPAM